MVPNEGKDEDDDGQDEDQWDEWVLRAHSPIPAVAVAEPPPEPLTLWVRRVTAPELFEHSGAEAPAFAAAARRLKRDLEALP